MADDGQSRMRQKRETLARHYQTDADAAETLREKEREREAARRRITLLTPAPSAYTRTFHLHGDRVHAQLSSSLGGFPKSTEFVVTFPPQRTDSQCQFCHAN